METLTPLPPLSILAVEDNPADIATVQWVLTAHALSYDLQVIANADQAFRFFDQFAQPAAPPCPDILLLDLTLPQRHGTELLHHLQTLPACADMRVVIFTCSRDPAERAETLALGADVYFVKPFHLTDFMLLGTIIKTLALHSAPAQRQTRRQQSETLRQQSQALAHRVQRLCARSAQLLQQAARLRAQRGG